jgi:hypothetical protein
VLAWDVTTHTPGCNEAEAVRKWKAYSKNTGIRGYFLKSTFYPYSMVLFEMYVRGT